MIPPEHLATMREALVARFNELDDIIRHGVYAEPVGIQETLVAIDAALAYLDTLPAAPAPDWSEAPEWAMWRAVDSNGGAWWYSIKPDHEEHSNTWIYVERCELDNSICPNWRTTLQARPTEDK